MSATRDADALAAMRLFDHEPPTAVQPSWRLGILATLLIALGTRLLVWAAAYDGAVERVRGLHDMESRFGTDSPAARLAHASPDSALAADLRRYVADFAPLLQWDAGHYRTIIEHGYSYLATPLANEPRPDAQFNIAFFPGYPALCRLVAAFVGVPRAMIGVSNVLSLIAAIILYVWARRLHNHETALLAVALVFCFPSACFYSFGYSESMLLCLQAACLILLQQRRFVPAALICGLATAVRPNALCLTPLLVWLAMGDAGPLWRRATVIRVVTIGALACLGIAAYFGYLWIAFGSPMVYAENLRVGWLGARGAGSWRQFLTLDQVWRECRHLPRAFADMPISLNKLADPVSWAVPLTLFVVGFSLVAMWRVSASIRPLLLLAPLIFLQRYAATAGADEQHTSMLRYVGLALPTFAVFAAWMLRKWRWGACAAVLTLLVLLQAVFAFRFGRGDWIG